MPFDIMKKKDDRICTRNEIFGFTVPSATKTYWPVPHKDIVECIEDQMKQNMPGYGLDKEYYVTNKSQERMFFKLYFRHDSKPDLVWGGRNGYDKMTSYAHGTGKGVFVCSNMCVSGDDVNYIRKHTRGVWEDVQKAITESTLSSEERLAKMQRKVDRMIEIEITDRRGWEFLGALRGLGLLKPSQESKAFKHWNDSPFTEFEARNVWSLYNSVTWALGQSRNPQHILSSHTNFHTQIEREFELA